VLEGQYEVDPIPGGKRLQGSWLVLDDGRRYVVSYRPVPEYFAFLDKRVVVQGRPYWPGRDTQHVGATHLAIDSIELAPGQVPYESVPTEVPQPPIVRTGDALDRREGRWARVVVVVIAVDDDPDGYLCVAQLQMMDGALLWVRNTLRNKWCDCVAQTVTVTGRWQRVVTPENEDGFELVGWCAVAIGDAGACDASGSVVDGSDCVKSDWE
jgi:hypothetical protein